MYDNEIAIHNSCRMCGAPAPAVEVALPHATREHKKACGVRGTLATAACRTCVRFAVAAWAEHDAAGNVALTAV